MPAFSFSGISWEAYITLGTMLVQISSIRTTLDSQLSKNAGRNSAALPGMPIAYIQAKDR